MVSGIILYNISGVHNYNEFHKAALPQQDGACAGTHCARGNLNLGTSTRSECTDRHIRAAHRRREYSKSTPARLVDS